MCGCAFLGVVAAGLEGLLMAGKLRQAGTVITVPDFAASQSAQASAAQPKLFVGMVLILIFAEALGLYGLIVGLILSAKAA